MRSDLSQMLAALSNAERYDELRLLPATGDETVTDEQRERIAGGLLIALGLDPNPSSADR